jgi:hypothetical protein
MTDEYGAPGLRERVIAVICEEWPKRQDNELQSATIYERLISEGVAVSENALRAFCYSWRAPAIYSLGWCPACPSAT